MALRKNNWLRRIIKERFVITSLKTFNRDSGMDLKDKWQGILKKFNVHPHM